MKTTSKSERIWTTFYTMLVALALVITGISPAAAQQGMAKPPPRIVTPGKQGEQTSTLELPAMPRQPSASAVIPPQIPQPGTTQELVLPTRQLRDQPGYEQVTVTVTGSTGTYVTGLQKDDFKLY